MVKPSGTSGKMKGQSPGIVRGRDSALQARTSLPGSFLPGNIFLRKKKALAPYIIPRRIDLID